MKKNKILLLLITLIISSLFVGCSKENLVGVKNSNTNTGRISLKIDKANVPSEVQQITAKLSRLNYDTLKTDINTVDDSLNVLSFEAIPAGEWHLTVTAANTDGKIIYQGETDVTIIEDETIDVYLTLNHVGSGTGSIKIFVNWENQWVDYYNNPVFTINDSPFQVLGVSQAQICFDNGKYKMWYMNLYPAGRGDISYAESEDGVNWSNISQSPVLTAGEYGSWDDQTVGMGAIYKENGVYKLYYLGMRGPYDKKQIGLATSQDGIKWEKYPNPVLESTDNEYQLGIQAVIKIGSTYYMYYGAYPYNSTVSTINLATSTDGIQWTRYSSNPIIKASDQWENNSITYASVVQEDDGLLLLYMNTAHDGFGLARSTDGIHWTKDQNNPVFSPEKVSNNWCYKISYPYLGKYGNEYRIYYTGVDYNNTWSIGYAKMKL